MKTILICQPKGGVGKSTTAVLLSFALVRAGGLKGRVALLDLDAQGSSSACIAQLPDEGVVLYRKQDPEPLIRLIDTEGKSAFEQVLSKAPPADLYIIPTSPSAFDIGGAARAAILLKKINPKARAYLLFNKVIKSARDSRPEVLQKYEEAIGLPRLKSVIHFRKSYDYAITGGWGKIETAEERDAWTNLATELLAHLI